MDREECIKILNENITKFDINSANRFIIEYLTEKKIELNRVQLFIKTISENPLFMMDNALSQCLVHSIKYFVSKYSINSVLKDNKTFYYY